MEEMTRMWVECHDAKLASKLFRFLGGDRDQFLVANMHAVEITDGDDMALIGGVNMCVALVNFHHVKIGITRFTKRQ